jgi:hypothetical protein
MRRDPNWDPLRVDSRTPLDVRDFITQKCGTKEEGCEGRKVRQVTIKFYPYPHLEQYSTAVSTRAALTF